MSEPKTDETGVTLVYSTFPDVASAENVVSALVSDGLVACANVIPGVVSVFIWEGKLQREQEVAVIMKTRAGLSASVIDALRARHPYETPAIVAWPIGAGAPAFLSWVVDQTRGAG